MTGEELRARRVELGLSQRLVPMAVVRGLELYRRLFQRGAVT